MSQELQSEINSGQVGWLHRATELAGKTIDVLMDHPMRSVAALVMPATTLLGLEGINTAKAAAATPTTFEQAHVDNNAKVTVGHRLINESYTDQNGTFHLDCVLYLSVAMPYADPSNPQPYATNQYPAPSGVTAIPTTG